MYVTSLLATIKGGLHMGHSPNKTENSSLFKNVFGIIFSVFKKVESVMYF